jgi:hypothetical protein
MLQPGQYAFKFSLALPSNLPSTAKAGQSSVASSITYAISAFVKEGKKKIKAEHREITIVSRPAPPTTAQGSVTNFLRFKLSRVKEPCAVTLQLSTLAPIEPGDHLPFHLTMNNRTSKKIRKVSAMLVVTLMAAAQGHTQRTTFSTSKKSLDIELASGATLDRNYSLRVPPAWDGYHSYSFGSGYCRGSIVASLVVTVSYGVAKAQVSRAFQISPNLHHLVGVPPPVYHLRRVEPQLNAEIMGSDVIPWYFYF